MIVQNRGKSYVKIVSKKKRKRVLPTKTILLTGNGKIEVNKYLKPEEIIGFPGSVDVVWVRNDRVVGRERL